MFILLLITSKKPGGLLHCMISFSTKKSISPNTNSHSTPMHFMLVTQLVTTGDWILLAICLIDSHMQYEAFKGISVYGITVYCILFCIDEALNEEKKYNSIIYCTNYMCIIVCASLYVIAESILFSKSEWLFMWQIDSKTLYIISRIPDMYIYILMNE